jgi:chromosome segregation ATPase
MAINKQEVLLTDHISELKSNINEMEKQLSKLKLMKHEYQERLSVLNDKCTRLKKTEVSINLLLVLLNNLTE